MVQLNLCCQRQRANSPLQLARWQTGWQRCCPRRSGEELLDEPAVDVGQAKVAALEAIRQPLVVEAEQVQQRRVQVVDVDLVLCHVEAELVALTNRHTSLHAAAGQFTFLASLR